MPKNYASHLGLAWTEFVLTHLCSCLHVDNRMRCFCLCMARLYIAVCICFNVVLFTFSSTGGLFPWLGYGSISWTPIFSVRISATHPIR